MMLMTSAYRQYWKDSCCPSSIDGMHWSSKQSQIQYQHQKMQDID